MDLQLPTTLRALLLACSAMTAVACQSVDTNTVSAKQFLEEIYSEYQPGRDGGARIFAEGAERVFASDLLALIREDQRISQATGELGLLDFDPICDCQDWEAIEIREIDVASTGGNTATANVTFKNFGQVSRLRFSLLRQSGAWRIQDIEARPSLVRHLSEGLDELRRSASP